MSNFQVGDVAVFVCDKSITTEVEFYEYDGMDCVIVMGYGLHPSWMFDVPTVSFGYLVRFFDGLELIVEPHELRKKQPPQSDELTAWTEALDCIDRAMRPLEVA